MKCLNFFGSALVLSLMTAAQLFAAEPVGDHGGSAIPPIPNSAAGAAQGAVQVNGANANVGVGANVNGANAAAHTQAGAQINAVPNRALDNRNFNSAEEQNRAAVENRNIDAGAQVRTDNMVAENRGAFADNRPDQWRYKWDNNRWWYWGADNRWMIYDNGNWTYYQPSQPGYTTYYGGSDYAAPSTGYYYPNTGYSYGTYYYPSYGYGYGYPGWGVGYRGYGRGYGYGGYGRGGRGRR